MRIYMRQMQTLMTSLTGETGCSLKRYFERHCFRVRERSAHSCHGFGKFQCSRALFVEGHLVGATTGLSAPAEFPASCTVPPVLITI
jgi:hypothetical protein